MKIPLLMYGSKMKLILLLFMAISIRLQVKGAFEFRNIKCLAVDKAYNSMKYCYIRSVNRSYKYISVANHFYSAEPITNISVGMNLLKKANGYKPFLYNFTIDGCKFLRSGGNPLTRFFYSLFAKYSNINHSCPYQHDIAVDRLPISHLDNLLTNVLPIPRGDYALETYWYTYNKLRTVVNIYWNVS